jgi:hypothetical protein
MRVLKSLVQIKKAAEIKNTKKSLAILGVPEIKDS